MDNEGKPQIKLIEIKKQKTNTSQSKTQTSKQTASLSKLKDKKEVKDQKKPTINIGAKAAQTKPKSNQFQKVGDEISSNNHIEMQVAKGGIEKGPSKSLKEADENEVFLNLVNNARKGDRVAFMNSIEM